MTKPPASIVLTLPNDSAARKEIPLLRGLLRYFPAALARVAIISKKGNDKHNPGEELHHARGKSSDHGDCIVRHLLDIQELQAQGAPAEMILDEAGCLAWRALALSQEIHESFGAPVAVGARLPENRKECFVGRTCDRLEAQQESADERIDRVRQDHESMERAYRQDP